MQMYVDFLQTNTKCLWQAAYDFPGAAQHLKNTLSVHTPILHLVQITI